jgi:hypothetical protein
MDRHDEIRDIALEILRAGLLRIRALGLAGDAKACSLEADHLHNLPDLVKSPCRDDLLRFYFNVERPAFRSATEVNVRGFETLWERLGLLAKENAEG